MAYPLDQKGQIDARSGADLGGNYSTHSTAGYHNSIFPQVGTDNAKLDSESRADATASGSLPIWAWAAIGALIALLIIQRKRGRK